MNQSTYDERWIRDALKKRQANFSNVICIESADPVRFRQLMRFLMTKDLHTFAEIYSFNPWGGLHKTGPGKVNHKPVSIEAGGAYDPSTQNHLRNTHEALNYMDGILKKARIALVLHDMDSSRKEEYDRDLINAMRDWAYNDSIVLSDSMIIIFCKDISMVLDAATMDRIAIIRPPLSLSWERKEMVRETGNALNSPDILNANLVDRLVQSTAGLNLHQLQTVLLESYASEERFSTEKIKELKSEIIKNTDLLEIEEPDPAGFKSIGGYEVVKQFVQNTIIRVLKEPERAKKLGLGAPRGIILFGPPGTGKTIFAKALAREIHLPFINFRTENLFSQFLGVSGHRFRDAINLVEQMSPAIVFIDEIDRLGKRRSDAGDGASEETRRVFNQILEWLGQKDRKSIIIGTTNRPNDMDKAFRVGRIDYWIPFLYPNRNARTKIFAIHLADNDLGAELINDIAQKTNGFSGAEIEELCKRARRTAFICGRDHLVPDDLYHALGTYSIDLTSRNTDRSKYLKMAEEFTNDLAFLRALYNE